MPDNIPLQNNWTYPTNILFGAGRIKELPELCKNQHINKPLLVTDSSLADIGFIQQILNDIRQSGIETDIFSAVKPNPGGANVEEGVDFFRKGKHDAVIAIGGGSALDAGKAVAFMSGQTKPLWDFEDLADNWKQADKKGIAPVIAIPTTAGTGSEVGRACVIVNEAEKLKKIIFHPQILPIYVIMDAELTTGLPPSITAATGMDAFVHNFEAYCSPVYHPMADGIALEGMRLIKEYLPVVVQDGNHIDGRSHMLVASMMGATAFQKGLGAVHALAHPIGALYDAHHGLLNAILLPYVMQANKNVIETHSATISRYLQLGEDSFDGLLDWVLDIRKRLNIPHTLADIEIDSNDSREIGKRAAVDPSAAGNPVNFDENNYTDIFCKAVNGELV